MRLVGKGIGGALGLLVALLAAFVPQAVSRSGAPGKHGAAAATVTVPKNVTTTTSTTPAPNPTITMKASTDKVDGGHLVVLSGRVTGAPPGVAVDLHASPYPYSGSTQTKTTTTRSNGAFGFNVYPGRNTRYRAILQGTSAQTSVVQVYVKDSSRFNSKPLPLGKARVTVVVDHPLGLNWGHRKVRWWFASGFRGHWIRAHATRTHNASRYAIKFSKTIAGFPAGHFRWRACFDAPLDHATLDPRRPPDCRGRGYQGIGFLPEGFPGPAAIHRAASYLASRGGHAALAVVDSEGRLSGSWNLHDQFITGSVVKAMLLAAYLRRLHDQGHHTVDSYSNSFLYPMIHVSDNNAATQCWSIVGNSGLYAVARAAHMTEFSVDTGASWGSAWGAALLSAADQAKFFFEQDKIIPHEFVGYARHLLSTIAGYEAWGIPAVARPLGYNVFFKGGWRPSPDVYLVHQIARLEGHSKVFSMAVMTDGDSGMGDGISKIQGTTSALLR